MTVQAVATVKRFFEGTASVAFALSSDSRGLRRAKDSMDRDLTDSDRFDGR